MHSTATLSTWMSIFLFSCTSFLITTTTTTTATPHPMSSARTFLRYDLDTEDLEGRRYSHNPKGDLRKPSKFMPPRRHATLTAAQRKSTDMITAEFICHPPSGTSDKDKSCGRVQRAFQGVFNMVQEAFDLQTPIRVKFEYSSFCQSGVGNGMLNKQSSNNDIKNSAKVQKKKETVNVVHTVKRQVNVTETVHVYNKAATVTVGHPSAATQTVTTTTPNEESDADRNNSGNLSASSGATEADCSSTAGLLGYAAPAAFWIPDAADPQTGLRYSYPQALVKQLTGPDAGGINLNDHDIYARFNADQEDVLWFKEDGKDIAQWQYDFEYIVLHEFMHGMGLVSSWNMPFDGLSPRSLASRLTQPTGSVLLAPVLASNDPNEMVITPQATTIFDKFLQADLGSGEKVSFNKFAEAILKPINSQPSRRKLGDLYTGTVNDKEASNAAQKAYKAATRPNSISFAFPDSSIAPMILHTEKDIYLSGTSIVHLSYETYTGTSDFLMRPYANNGTTLAGLAKASGITGKRVFGEGTLRIFETMGYSIWQGAGAKSASVHKGSKWSSAPGGHSSSSSSLFGSTTLSLFFTISSMLVLFVM